MRTAIKQIPPEVVQEYLDSVAWLREEMAKLPPTEDRVY